MTDPELHGERVALRPLREGDADEVAAILAEEEVARWWSPTPSPAEVRSRFVRDADTHWFAVVYDHAVAGIIGYTEETDPDYRHAGLDIALTSRLHGQGIGVDSIRTMARYLFEGLDHHRITIDPAAKNAKAIGAYRAVGFRPIGVMRRYERGPDGTWHDGLLMDLLAEELG